MQSLFANQMLRGAEELFSSALNGKEVQDWYNYQEKPPTSLLIAIWKMPNP